MKQNKKISIIVALAVTACFGLYFWISNSISLYSFAASTGVTVSGNKFLLNGQPFTPEGFISVALLDTTGYSQGCSNATTTAAANNFGATELSNLASKWNSNTVRFQVSQQVLASTDGVKYAQHIQSDVNQLTQRGFVVFVSMQDESWGCGPAAPLPSQQTEDAWNTLITNTSLKNNHYVIFEIYNEPQNSSTTTASTDPTVWNWPDWQNGGRQIEPTDWPTCGSNPSSCKETWTPYTPVGHQQIVNDLRSSLGVTNVIVADGASFAGTLSGVPLLTDPGGNHQIAYAVHLLNPNSSQTSWDSRFGTLSATEPIVADSFGCATDSSGNLLTTKTDAFLGYALNTVHIGVVAYLMDWFGTNAPFMTDTALDPNACGKLFQQDYTSHFTAPQPPSSSTTTSKTSTSAAKVKSSASGASATGTNGEGSGTTQGANTGGTPGSANAAGDAHNPSSKNGSLSSAKSSAHALPSKRVAYYTGGGLALLVVFGVTVWHFFVRWRRHQIYSSPYDMDRYGISAIPPNVGVNPPGSNKSKGN